MMASVANGEAATPTVGVCLLACYDTHVSFAQIEEADHMCYLYTDPHFETPVPAKTYTLTPVHFWLFRTTSGA